MSVNAIFTIVLSKAVSTPVTVDYTTVDGTAKAGENYTATSGTLTFPANTTSMTVSVPVNSPVIVKPSGLNFSLSLSNISSGAVLSSSTTCTCTIEAAS